MYNNSINRIYSQKYWGLLISRPPHRTAIQSNNNVIKRKKIMHTLGTLLSRPPPCTAIKELNNKKEKYNIYNAHFGDFC